jgi:putative transposase
LKREHRLFLIKDFLVLLKQNPFLLNFNEMKNETKNTQSVRQLPNRKSIRLKGYDYSQAGLYFITICCDDRKCLFGKISDGKMIFNETGNVANECWLQIPKHFPNAILHEYIIMPNHVHGIIELIPEILVGIQDNEPRTQNIEWAQNVEPRQNEFQKIIPHSIGSIIRGFKIGVTKWIRQTSERSVRAENIQPQPKNIQPQLLKSIWQRNYYEHIIRNYQAYQNISNYIINNPTKWDDDKFFL